MAKVRGTKVENALIVSWEAKGNVKSRCCTSVSVEACTAER